ncbi:MAG TPA: hypothetical protein VNN74_07840 [Candidatus Micrarchaeia archaeon]|nr:hypothetical protein [Candidatus Micrarchaeia archaeon]
MPRSADAAARAERPAVSGHLAAELTTHRTTCPSCRWGGPDGCPVALAIA